MIRDSSDERKRLRNGDSMKVLWLCNIMLPVVAEHFQRESSNKEGWLSGLLTAVLSHGDSNGIELAVAFPVAERLSYSAEAAGSDTVDAADRKNVREHHDGTEACGHRSRSRGICIPCGETYFTAYDFVEDTTRPDLYDPTLEQELREICEDFAPDVVHCFGTEYPHTLAMCRAFPRKDRILIGIQGLCAVYAQCYFADLPEAVVNSVTFRDLVKKDTLKLQQEKFVRRGEMEIEAIRLAGNVTGRTAWDRYYTGEWHPGVNYYPMNETLRSNFYTGQWNRKQCIPHSIFLSQGDYPIKGLHYMLLAMPRILKQFPDTEVYVAGNSLTAYGTLKEKLKISAYGRYLRKLLKEEHLENKVHFLGRLSAQQMKEQYLKSHLFVCPSSIENSPNSLGEAMLLGMPCVSAEVGGIASIFTGGEDGVLYPGFKIKNNDCDCKNEALENISKSLADACVQIWSDLVKEQDYCINARKHAKKNHNPEQNYKKMVEIYAKICNGV